MKKIIICLFLFCVSNIYSNNFVTIDNKIFELKEAESVNKQGSKLNKIIKVISFLGKSTDSVLNYVLSIKGISKILILSSPFIWAYCKATNIDLIKDFAGNFIRVLGKAKTFYDIEIEAGSAQAQLEIVTYGPIQALQLYGSRLMDKFLSFGIPAIFVLAFNKIFK
ncbi:MAG: hypothetical protein PHS34_08310 [Candidatus Omnitrophica bacterium]|nr:hypothetical protein [Candidatus Omnitrophota bacterium]